MACRKLKLACRFRLFQLDECYRIIPDSMSVFDDTSSIESISWTDSTDGGERETTTAIDGSLCIDDTSCYNRLGRDWTLNNCGINDALEAMFGWQEAVSGLPTGMTAYKEISPDCDAAVAMSIEWCPDSGACDASGNTLCYGYFVPVMKRFRPGGNGGTMDGKTTMKGSWTGTSVKGNGRTFELFPGGVPTGELAHIADLATAIASADTMVKYEVPCGDYTAIEQGCDLRTLVV